MNRIRRLLEEKRLELADQLNAVDKAIAAFDSARTPVTETQPAEPDARAELTVSAVLPQTVEPRRVLSDAHKAAISAGKRREHAAKDAAKGLGREVPDDSFVPAISTRGSSQSPRLVKRPVQK